MELQKDNVPLTFRLIPQISKLLLLVLEEDIQPLELLGNLLLRNPLFLFFFLFRGRARCTVRVNRLGSPLPLGTPAKRTRVHERAQRRAMDEEQKL